MLVLAASLLEMFLHVYWASLRNDEAVNCAANELPRRLTWWKLVWVNRMWYIWSTILWLWLRQQSHTQQMPLTEQLWNYLCHSLPLEHQWVLRFWENESITSNAEYGCCLLTKDNETVSAIITISISCSDFDSVDSGTLQTIYSTGSASHFCTDHLIPAISLSPHHLIACPHWVTGDTPGEGDGAGCYNIHSYTWLTCMCKGKQVVHDQDSYTENRIAKQFGTPLLKCSHLVKWDIYIVATVASISGNTGGYHVTTSTGCT